MGGAHKAKFTRGSAGAPKDKPWLTVVTTSVVRLPRTLLYATIPTMDWRILGHQWAVELLAEHTAHGGLRHAYLFTGPSGVGRRTLALRLAQAVNCLQPPAPGQPCGTCSACTRLEKMQHPDLAILQAEQVGGTLKVDQVRELQRSLSLAPYEANYRVALLLRFEEAHPGAANALLKTLEEPAPKVLLFLTAESVESLLPTIVSRCEVLRLRPLPVAEASEGLQRWGIPADEAQLLAHISGGRPGYAFHLHDNPELLEQRQGWLNELATLLGTSRVERFAYARSTARAASDDREGLRRCLQTWSTFWRDVVLLSSGSSAPLTNLDWSAQTHKLANEKGLESARAILDRTEQTLSLIDRNVNTRLALENLMLDLPQARL
jgi:DNA polymerase-3 subunit delta'